MASARKKTASAAAAGTPAGTIRVRQVRSQIGILPKTRATMRALGLRKIGDVNELPDRPEIRGMLARVPHLVEITPTRAKGA